MKNVTEAIILVHMRSVSSALSVIGWVVFVRRFRLLLGQCVVTGGSNTLIVNCLMFTLEDLPHLQLAKPSYYRCGEGNEAANIGRNTV